MSDCAMVSHDAKWIRSAKDASIEVKDASNRQRQLKQRVRKAAKGKARDAAMAGGDSRLGAGLGAAGLAS